MKRVRQSKSFSFEELQALTRMLSRVDRIPGKHGHNAYRKLILMRDKALMKQLTQDGALGKALRESVDAWSDKSAISAIKDGANG